MAIKQGLGEESVLFGEEVYLSVEPCSDVLHKIWRDKMVMVVTFFWNLRFMNLEAKFLRDLRTKKQVHESNFGS